MKRDLVLVALGLLLGTIVMNTYLARRLDDLYIEREKLRVTLFETTERLKKIEAQWQSHQTVLVRDVEVQFCKESSDPFVELALREEVMKLAQNLIGENIEDISWVIAVDLFDNRIIEADEQKYRLHVETLVISEKITYIMNYEHETEQTDDEP